MVYIYLLDHMKFALLRETVELNRWRVSESLLVCTEAVV